MYTIKLEQFNGPLDLLLSLIEKEKLDICDISLARVTGNFLNYINEIDNIHAQELADFLEIAAKLILFKSRLLIPDVFSDEEEIEDLVGALKVYQEYAKASKKVGSIVLNPNYAFAKEKIPLNVIHDLSEQVNITPRKLEKYFSNIVGYLLDSIKLVQKTIKREVISLKSKINEIFDLLKNREKFIFNHVIKNKNKAEQAVMFLAVLELMKQRQLNVDQEELFGEIIISKLYHN